MANKIPQAKWKKKKNFKITDKDEHGKNGMEKKGENAEVQEINILSFYQFHYFKQEREKVVEIN